MSKKPSSLKSFCVSEPKDNKSTKPHQLPIYATSSFVFENAEEGIDIFTGKKSGHVYSRYGNPTIDTVSAKIAAMETFGTDLKAYAYMTSSGMSAISTLIYALASAGDKVITQANLYGGTTELFSKVAARHGITPLFTDFADLSQVESIVQDDPAIKIIYLETPANPTLACVDMAALSSIAARHNLITIIDNTFCTPYLQQPFKFGIDFIIHSTTKFLNGHGNSIAGIIIGHKAQYNKDLFTTLKLMGGTCNAWDAWLLNNGVKTLALRMERHCENAMALAEFLSAHQEVEFVNYNGLPEHPFHEIASRQMSGYGAMLSFAIKGETERALDVINKLELSTQAPTLGDVDTLVLHPATSSHLNIDRKVRIANGIPDNLIRVSVGIEDSKDIIQDFAQALG